MTGPSAEANLTALRARVEAVLEWDWGGMLDQADSEEADPALADMQALQGHFDETR